MSSVTGWPGEGDEGVGGQKRKEPRELCDRTRSIVPAYYLTMVLLTIVSVFTYMTCVGAKVK